MVTLGWLPEVLYIVDGVIIDEDAEGARTAATMLATARVLLSASEDDADCSDFVDNDDDGDAHGDGSSSHSPSPAEAVVNTFAAKVSTDAIYNCGLLAFVRSQMTRQQTEIGAGGFASIVQTLQSDIISRLLS